MTRKIVALIALTMVLGTLPNTTYELNTITEKIMEASLREPSHIHGMTEPILAQIVSSLRSQKIS